jgi:hypothetical protein
MEERQAAVIPDLLRHWSVVAPEAPALAALGPEYAGALCVSGRRPRVRLLG